MEKDCWFKGKPPIQCRYCKKMGHIERNCRSKQNQEQERPTQQANYTEEEENEPKAKLFMVSQSSQSAEKQTWYIDSGCTSHMSKDEGLFNQLDKSIKTKVKLGNGTVVEAQGKDSVAVQTKENTKYIHDVLSIPCLTQNLLSVAQMLQNGYSLSFKDKCCYIYDPYDELIAKLPMIDKSFPLNWNSVCENVNYVKVDESWLWHKRYGHFNFAALVSLYN